MFDDGFCEVEYVPCDKDEEFPEQQRTGPMSGINGMDIVSKSPEHFISLLGYFASFNTFLE
jgi:hypothetical protein